MIIRRVRNYKDDQGDLAESTTKSNFGGKSYYSTFKKRIKLEIIKT